MISIKKVYGPTFGLVIFAIFLLESSFVRNLQHFANHLRMALSFICRIEGTEYRFFLPCQFRYLNIPILKQTLFENSLIEKARIKLLEVIKSTCHKSCSVVLLFSFIHKHRFNPFDSVPLAALHFELL